LALVFDLPHNRKNSCSPQEGDGEMGRWGEQWWKNRGRLANAFEIAIRVCGDQQFVLDFFVNLKLLMSFQKFVHGCFRIVSFVPWSIGEVAVGLVFEDGIEHD
jgi:hypothetical protein